jgi:acetyltransferase-like isoleucine patch superfamily enzyme
MAGAYTYFESGRIGSLRSIGNYCSVAPGCSIGNGNHPKDYLSTHPLAFKAAGAFGFDSIVKSYKGGIPRTSSVISCPPTIGNDVWIGGNATIYRGITIGSGAIIGANTLVNKDIPPFAIAVGSPVRIIGYRFPEEIREQLLSLKWWDYDIANAPPIDFDKIEIAIRQIKEMISNGKLKLLDETRKWVRVCFE